MRHGPEKERLLKLTLAVYNVTAIFPIGEEGDNLGSKIRQLADKILVKLSSDKIDEIFKLFDQAEKKNLVDPRNFLVLKREYEAIRQPIGIGEKQKEKSNGNRNSKIIEAVNGSGMVKIGDLLRMLPGVNRRTVLRDLDKLCQTGIMIRNGNGRGAYYAKCDMSH